jgi:F-type H+-transporting ATPase subunit delta
MSKTTPTVTVTSAVKLTAAQIEKIEKAYKKQTGTTATVVSVIDTSVLGGIKIMAGSTQVDGTVKNKLQTIRTQLLNI